MRSSQIIAWLLAEFLALCIGSAGAQPYPVKPIRVIVAGPSGGAPDVLARIVGPKVANNVGQPVIVDNRPGAGGTLGTAIAAEATPDGHTVLLAFAAYAIYPSLYPNLGYDPIKALTPVVLVATVTPVLVVNPSLPVSNLKDFIALAKAKPGALIWASSGNGSMSHLNGEMLKSMTGINVLHVPYKGGTPALTDVLAGQASSYMPNIPTVLGHIKAGKLKALAVTTARRSPLLPSVPTFAESGVAGYEVTDWFGLLVPARTSRDIVARLNSEINAVLNAAGMTEQLASVGFEVAGGTTQRFATQIQADLKKWAKVVKDSGARID